ncbi:MAG: helix-turn-helix domain-containing protein, partial [Verrucomicrobiota bacterium]
MTEKRRPLTVADRTLIELRLLDGMGVRAIAKHLGRSPGTVSDEIKRHSGSGAYRAHTADIEAMRSRMSSGRRNRLAPDGELFRVIIDLLRLKWSPEQIAGRRKRVVAGVVMESGLQVSHEAIYAAIYALPRGSLRKELISCLRQDKPIRGRKPKAIYERRTGYRWSGRNRCD